jgi:RecT family
MNDAAQSNLAQWSDGGAPAPMSPTAMLFDMSVFEAMDRMADIMASGSVSVPGHLRGKKADCFAICMQAAQWGMNPFAVAQKTHVSKSGQLGYEAQLINAVVCNLAPIQGRPDYEFIGDWSKVLGKVEERKGQQKQDGTEGGKYYVATYTKADEDGLGVIIRCTLRGEAKPREATVMMAQCYPRFSTQWATDPAQQICYVSIRKWARRFTPDVLLGVYSGEELDAHLSVRDMGRAEEVSRPAPPASRSEAVRTKLTARSGTPPAQAKEKAPESESIDSIIANIEAATTSHELTKAIEPVIRLRSEPEKERARAAYQAKLASEKARAQREAEAQAKAEPAPPAAEAQQPVPFSYAEIADAITHSENSDDLDAAADLIGAVKDVKQRGELVDMFRTRQGELDC